LRTARGWFRLGLLALLALAVLGLAFVALKVRSVARELVDPPFYRPQSLVRVEATFQELAEGDGADPGGAWETHAIGPHVLWRLRRRVPAPGVALLLHGFGDDRWGTSPALRWFPQLDAAIFTYLRRDEAIRAGRTPPPVTFGARESEEVVEIVHGLEAQGTPRGRILLMGRSLGASVGLLALARLEREGRGPLGGIIWEGAPASSRDFAEPWPAAWPGSRGATARRTPTCWRGPGAWRWPRRASASSPPRTGWRRPRCSGRWPPGSRTSAPWRCPRGTSTARRFWARATLKRSAKPPMIGSRPTYSHK
jgi:hypothetical protein